MTTTKAKTKTIWQLHHPSGSPRRVDLLVVRRVENPVGRIHDASNGKRYDEFLSDTVALDPGDALALARHLIDFAEAAMRKGR